MKKRKLFNFNIKYTHSVIEIKNYLLNSSLFLQQIEGEIIMNDSSFDSKLIVSEEYIQK
jgi:DUF4097 and DUF4098 domain-containing protein YvlB